MSEGWSHLKYSFGHLQRAGFPVGHGDVWVIKAVKRGIWRHAKIRSQLFHNSLRSLISSGRSVEHT